MDYKKELQTLDESIFSQMRLCSFDLVCQEYEIDFAPLEKHELYKLYKDEQALSAYFTIPGSLSNALKIYLPKEKYDEEVFSLQKSLVVKFVIVVLAIALLSLLFSIYALTPYRNALALTEEFIKDILHDFNTPLSTLRLNISMLKEERGESSKIKRIENSVQNILNLQANLRAYLTNHKGQKESFELKELLQERVSSLEKSFKEIEFIVDVEPLTLETNRESFTRVIDNLLSNAAKYNRRGGKVIFRLEGKTLVVEDTGKGIRNPQRVFDRFYKEQERGIGIGLHIVKKLCDELEIEISLESELNSGTKFYLDLSQLTLY